MENDDYCGFCSHYIPICDFVITYGDIPVCEDCAPIAISSITRNVVRSWTKTDNEEDKKTDNEEGERQVDYGN